MIESPGVRLSDLFAGVEDRRLAGAADVAIDSLAYRSDQAGPGCLFFCVPGFARDGHDFAAAAVARGAVAVCVERLLDLPVAQVVVPSVRAAMGPVAAAFYGHPSSKLVTVGITGTNGKTTSAFLSAHLLDRAGLPAGLLGTVERRIGGRTLPAGRTTPEALDIQRDLAGMLAAGDKAAVMEVSSHALDLGRARGTRFRTVAFTNLTQDHLDYHKSLEDYFAAKTRLFLDAEFAPESTMAVINVDDPFGRRLAQQCAPERVLSLSTVPVVPDWGPADLQWSEYSMRAGGTRGTLILRGKALAYARQSKRGGVARGGAVAADPAGRAGASGAAPAAAEARVEVFTRLVGAFNVANVLTALGIGLALGLDLEQMLAAVADFGGVPGRMESVDAGQDFTVLVDYAHTPDSVANVLKTARGITEGKLIAVLGCGGDRDKTKRPLMGREAEKAADLVVITSDNPRTEDPSAIIADIVAGLESPADVTVQPDRRSAILTALRAAAAGDVVMILGKGHESGQEFATETVPFDDRQVAREALGDLLAERR
ncbi:MAG: UDP-N-acetylmuramoyl-L-alanyl-D-glutamate--2,6-diaminopimelate ligase [Actinomycetia bacterium]|nr:UDP-N-acetylmuramoyl-L-alanyl-D-glutamate--2,6-diaminopimelate ligase [Actinomycetes bacterium]